MAIAFTPEQERVIQLHNRNILVSAAAGSGKTAVLVERIVRMVCDETDPVDIDRLLIVTFTNAAAAEMRERIDLGIAEQLKEHPESEHIQKQATLLHNAQITTIDSFCLFIIRNHFHEIGLDPAFRVADENEVKLLKQDVLGELLEESFAAGEADFINCVEFFCPGGRESTLENNILDLSDKAAGCTFPADWLRARKEDYADCSGKGLLSGETQSYLMHYLEAVVSGCAGKLEEVQRLCEEPDGPHMYGAMVESEKEMVEGLLRAHTFEEYAALIPTVVFERLPGKKDESVDPEKRELAKNLRDEVKACLKKLTEDFFQTSVPLALERAEGCSRAVNTLIDLTLEFDRRVQEKKAEKKLIDFSDMEHLALQILLDVEDDRVRPSKVAREYRQYFHEILIDEYQDSNLAQEALLEAVSGEQTGRYNRFMVGDVKQSIYGFRQARPELFLEKYDTYKADGESCCRIDLSKNYRSRSQVVDTVNSIFGRIMSKEVGGLEYDDNARLYAKAEYVESTGNESEMILVEKPGKEEEQNARQAEAKAVALRIKELKKEFQVMDKVSRTLRPVRYSDMVILLRTNQGWDEEFKKVMEQEGIPVYVTSKTGYFAAREVQELLQVLRVLDNPRQDIPLYGMLKSVFGGFTEEEIGQIRGEQKKVSLYEALKLYVDAGGREAKRVSDFLAEVDRYRSYTVYMPIRALLQRLVEDYDYLNYVTALPAGSKRRANVEMLLTKASDFEKTSYFGLFHFLRYMEQLEKYEVDYGEADLLDENADVVRIMSIHKSKGLEFPVTFVAGMGKQFNEQDSRRALIADVDMGLGVTFMDPESRIRCKTLRQNVIAKKMWEDSLAEELRVLYVALTRAREKLILTASVKDALKTWERVQKSPLEKLDYLSFVNARSYMDFLMPILPNTDLRVKVIGGEELAAEELSEQIDMGIRKDRLEELAGAAELKGETKTLLERLSYVYPHANLQKLYTKTTVSELKEEAMAEKDEAAHDLFGKREREPYLPKFLREEKKVSGTLRGSAFHRAMEILDFEEILGELPGGFPENYEDYADRTGKLWGQIVKRLEEFVQRERESLRLSEEYFEAVNPRKLAAFLRTECAYRMWRAQKNNCLYREQPFVLGIDAQRLAGRFGEDAPEGETVLIQGIIDVFWMEGDHVILLDYKTDKIDSMESLWNRYEAQMDYYSQALNRILGKTVTERVLYSSFLEEAGGR